MKTNIDFFEQFFTKSFFSEYDHSNYIDEINHKKFFHMDCSGFVYWCLIQMGYTRALVELRSFLRKHDFIKINRFFCKDFIFIYNNQHEFKYWNFLKQPVLGCVLVIVFPDGNGHCMFIDDIKTNDKNKLCLRVIDSTRYPHKNDTRKHNETGIGIGDIEITRENDGWFYNSCNSLLSPQKSEIYFISPIKNH